MKLVPKHPPGALRRTAGLFGDQIGELHALGYSLTEIQRMLADAGTVVAKSTVHREVKLWQQRQGAHPPASRSTSRRGTTGSHQTEGTKSLAAPRGALHVTASAPPGEPLTAQAPSVGRDLANERRSGHDVAAEYFQPAVTNTLLRKRGKGKP